MSIDLPSLEGLNEADVREEFITPLLHRLGYRSGTSANIIREISLRYPRKFLGRKDLSKDPPLRGRADYILEVGGRVRWTIEAKAPGWAISPDDIEQAYSYACHPEVRAVLFAIINGSEIRIYQTSNSPDTPAILTLSGSEILTADSRLANVVGPDALVRDYPVVEPDAHEPLGPGLRSVVRIANGWAEFHESTPPIPLLAEITVFFTAGAIERDEHGRLVMYLEGRSPLRSLNELNARLGLTAFEMHARDHVLSVDTTAPTLFSAQLHVAIAAGETLPNFFGDVLVLAHNVRVTSTTVGRGVLSGKRLVGDFDQSYEYQDLPEVGNRFSIRAHGRCELTLA